MTPSEKPAYSPEEFPSGKRIIIVDDHQCLRDMLHREFVSMGLEVVAETGDGDDAVELIGRHKPDLVVLDLALNGLNGFEVAHRSREQGFTGAFLVFTGQVQPYVLHRIREMRFEGVVLKSGSLDTWLEGVRRLLEGKTYRGPIFEQASVASSADTNCPSRLLTPRETEILAQIGLAHTNDEIARKTGISPNTVQNFRRKLCHKLDLPDTPALVRFAQEQGYAAFPPTKVNRARSTRRKSVAIAP